MKLNELSLTEASSGLKKRDFSALELTSACLSRISEVDKDIKAFLALTEKEALDQARRADERIGSSNGALFGIPFAVKDNYCTKGIRTTASSKVLDDFVPPYDATAFKKVREAGAVLLGKTNMDAWAHGSSTETSDYFVTKNPLDLTRLPGGSSGGSAAAVAAHECIFALGTETAGSIRQPAAWCGIVGLKPTYGRVSRYGIIAMCSSTDSPGPLTKTVEDAALVFLAMAGHDPLDATSSAKKLPTMKSLKDGVKGLKIGVPKEYFEIELQEGVRKRVEEGIEVLKRLGAKIIPVSLLHPKYSIAVYTIIQRSEVSSNLARYDGIRYGYDRTFFGEEAKRRIMLGTYTLSSGYYDQYYSQAQKIRTLIVKDFERVFREVDVIVAPASPSVALPIGASKESAMFGELQDVLFEASSLAGLPGISIPCGFVDKLPVGIQFIGPQFAEEIIFRSAWAFEKEHSLK